jgi:hypothetical protein
VLWAALHVNTMTRIKLNYYKGRADRQTDGQISEGTGKGSSSY